MAARPRRQGVVRALVGRRPGVSFVAAGLVFLLAASGCTAARAAADPEAAMLGAAPPESWAAFYVDLAAVETSPLGPFYHAIQREPPCGAPGAARVAVFLLPSGQSSDDYYWRRVSLVRTDGTTAEGMRAQFESRGTPATVEGLDAYRIAEYQVVAVMDDTTALVGTDPEALAAGIRAYRNADGAGLTPAMRRLLAPLHGYTMYGSVRAQAPEPGVMPENSDAHYPDSLARSHCIAVGLKLSEGLEGLAAFECRDADDARRLQEDAETQLAFVRDGWQKVVNALEQGTFEREPARPREPSFLFLDYACLLALLFCDGEISVNGADAQIAAAWSPEELARFVNVMLQPAVDGVAAGELQGRSLESLHRLGIGIQTYARDHDWQSPPSLDAVVEGGYVDSADALIDPADKTPSGRTEGGRRCSYEYVGPIPPNAPRDVIVCYLRKGIWLPFRNVLKFDSSIEVVPEDQLRDPRGDFPSRSLPASYEAVVKAFGDELTPERNAELRAFYEIGDDGD
jgi:hypothetical protein